VRAGEQRRDSKQHQQGTTVEQTGGSRFWYWNFIDVVIYLSGLGGQ